MSGRSIFRRVSLLRSARREGERSQWESGPRTSRWLRARARLLLPRRRDSISWSHSGMRHSSMPARAARHHRSCFAAISAAARVQDRACVQSREGALLRCDQRGTDRVNGRRRTENGERKTDNGARVTGSGLTGNALLSVTRYPLRERVSRLPSPVSPFSVFRFPFYLAT